MIEDVKLYGGPWDGALKAVPLTEDERLPISVTFADPIRRQHHRYTLNVSGQYRFIKSTPNPYKHTRLEETP